MRRWRSFYIVGCCSLTAAPGGTFRKNLPAAGDQPADSLFAVAAPRLSTLAAPQSPAVTIKVDAGPKVGPMKPIWAWFGYDEPNYTYMKDGQKLLTDLSKLSPVPVYVRVHNLLTTGDGTPGLKWGSTNAYTEDAGGKPIYDWTIVDRIVDTYLERKMKPLMEIGFMPEALSSKPQPYKHDWQPGAPYNRIYTGWAHPPRDYDKWRELIYQWVKHSVEKYGRAEVESWWWEVWNEPDIGYWQGTPEEYMKMYDYAADGLKRALPTARIGGPHVTGPLGERTQKYLRDFLEHCFGAVHGRALREFELNHRQRYAGIGECGSHPRQEVGSVELARADVEGNPPLDALALPFGQH